jgi:hypothetical protein
MTSRSVTGNAVANADHPRVIKPKFPEATGVEDFLRELAKEEDEENRPNKVRKRYTVGCLTTLSCAT